VISTQVIIQFGTGTLNMGCAKCKGEPDQWYIAIRPKIGPPAVVGESIETKDFDDSQEIILTFPTEKQMLIVKGAFVNKSYEETKEAWDKAQADKEETFAWNVVTKADSND